MHTGTEVARSGQFVYVVFDKEVGVGEQDERRRAERVGVGHVQQTLLDGVDHLAGEWTADEPR